MRAFERDGCVHASAIGKTERRLSEKKNDKISRMSKSRLIRSYLCHGEESACVICGKCCVLDECRYGQRYLEIARNENEK